ncbi:hypothetical protein K450DRAFT_285315 [Umbelopsis ramanniana AG]|uniref:Uncharacterized protein n=1 Tax=Umbelopsis ramanniana AG TaxID=1314678 RepID=A0AAD5EGX5_UMBRA|nr:uncharacterized protein K450DRAFT_285315 [Umbelopsis ramanniana AG]KAI8582055.1 hypothetical protein K450DRAFT_285315 [Umbelopsis ramanniana AG]
MDVLFPKGFVIGSIEKCMMDYDCKFIEYDDEEAINSRLGSSFIVLEQTHFIAHYPNKQVKCDYNCRNRIMKDLLSDDPWVSESYLVEKIDDVIRSKSPPYLLFTNECLRDSSAEDGSIIANYITVDIPRFAEITRSKQCNDKFFMVNLGDDQHLCCNIQTLETYKYHSCVRYSVLDLISGGSEEGFNQLHSKYDNVKMLTPIPKNPSFKLFDIEGNSAEENREYQLEMYDQDMDALNFFDGKISATTYYNQVEVLVVKYSIVDGIHYLTYDNKYLHVADGSDEISLTDQIPNKHQRLYFVPTEDNAFIVFKWNSITFLTLEVFTNSYSSCSFKEEGIFTNRSAGTLEFFLKRV